ncbi:MAG TPA: lmo0937 family membrane protein [Terriglobales bacterium]|nr:lmo0937 family membrane protein [Terriglobales bacterium]
MLWTIVVLLLILWLLGFSLSIAGSFIHLLIVIALVLVAYDLFYRRRRV